MNSRFTPCFHRLLKPQIFGRLGPCCSNNASYGAHSRGLITVKLSVPANPGILLRPVVCAVHWLAPCCSNDAFYRARCRGLVTVELSVPASPGNLHSCCFLLSARSAGWPHAAQTMLSMAPTAGALSPLNFLSLQALDICIPAASCRLCGFCPSKPSKPAFLLLPVVCAVRWLGPCCSSDAFYGTHRQGLITVEPPVPASPGSLQLGPYRRYIFCPDKP